MTRGQRAVTKKRVRAESETWDSEVDFKTGIRNLEEARSVAPTRVSQWLKESALLNVVRAKALSRPEVLEYIFKYVDFKDLKSCRRVCKGWNMEVSRLFRLKGVAGIRDRSYPCRNMKGLSAFQETVEAGENLELPNPFQDLKVAMELARIAPLCAQLGKSEFSLTSLVFISKNKSTMDIRNYAASAVRLISLCTPSLLSLNTPAWGVSPEILAAPLEFPELKRLTVFFKGYRGQILGNNNFVYSQEYYFVKCLASSPKLVELHVDGESNDPVIDYEDSYVYKLFSSGPDLRRIQVLSVHIAEKWGSCRPATVHKTLETFLSLDIDQLRKLEIRRSYPSTPLVSQSIFEDIVARFSDSLREFSTNFSFVEPFRFPKCLHLTELSLGSVNLQDIDLSRLLHLKKITINDTSSSERSSLAPLPSVVSLRISEPDEYRHWSVTPENVLLVQELFQRFPNVRNWEVSDEFFKALKICMNRSNFPIAKIVTYLTLPAYKTFL